MAEPRGTDPTTPRDPVAARRVRPGDRRGGVDHFTVPLGTSRSGRLRFVNGAHRVAIRADSRIRGLCRARFGERTPTLRVQGGAVTIRYSQAPSCDWLGCRSERPAEVELNTHIPWEIEVTGGASRLVADLRGSRLGSLSLEGGASRVEVVLPGPSGSVAVIVLGGASNVAIRRPEGVAARLRVGGGATNLKFDDRRIGVAGGELDLRSRDYDGANDRYDVVVTGGANYLSIDKQPGRTEGANLDLEGE